MPDSLRFLWRVLTLGADGLNTAAGWIGAIVLAVGVAAGVTVPLVFHGPHWLRPVIILSVVIVVVLIGSYRVWREADQRAQTAERGKQDAECREQDAKRALREAQAVFAATARTRSLKDVNLRDRSKLRVNSSASTLAEGLGMSGEAEIDAQHFPGQPQQFPVRRLTE